MVNGQWSFYCGVHCGVHCGVQCRVQEQAWSMVIPLINRWKKWAGWIALGEVAWVSCTTNTIWILHKYSTNTKTVEYRQNKSVVCQFH